MSDLTTNKKLRALLLLRVSTTQQVSGDDDCPLPVQKEKCTAVCEENGWEIVDTINESKSGYKIKMNDRAAILEIQRRAEAKEFDVLVVFKQDRIGRKGSDTACFIMYLIEPEYLRPVASFG